VQLLTLHMAFDGPDYFSAVEPSCNSFKNVLSHSREKKLKRIRRNTEVAVKERKEKRPSGPSVTRLCRQKVARAAALG